jgi:hypothetical protein
MKKQEAIELRNTYTIQCEYALNQIGLTIGSRHPRNTEKITVGSTSDLEKVLSCFSFEETYIDIDWSPGWRGIGFVIEFNCSIPPTFTLTN